ncbi:MAG: putative peptidoglycan glycosyltransferase FtsW [Candidatus Paceibacterota bacterium]
MNSRAKIDRFFLLTTGALAIAGFVIFLSASLGLLTQNGANFGTIALKQMISLILGGVLFFVISKIKYTNWRKLAFFIFFGAVAVNLLLFIPSLTLHYNGASRWLSFGLLSFQPSELLKIGFIIYLSAWIHFARDRIRTFRFGLVPYIVLMSILGVLLLIQSDTDTLVIIGATGIAMLFIAGLPLRYIMTAGLFGVILVVSVVFLRPYAMERVKVFFDRNTNTQGSSYQINQSLIAIGSGGLFGRGFGQSIQKFGYLPQPTDDSIYAVAAEEFGFFGSMILLTFYALFVGSAFRVGTRAQDSFGAAVATGIAILVVSESFLNIAAMLGLVPVSGLPLLFVSNGGTALVITLASAGIVANISKYKK